MKGDFSRHPFRKGKHYNGVLMQQGRVQLDADWNEQQAISRHRTQTQGADLVGPTGAPRVSPGFAITPQGSILSISRGNFYVDGILCENETDLPFSAQPDLRPLSGNLLPVPAGLYLAYLEVWDRHISALEDEQIRETALGGPDTATRSQTVWQVKLLHVTDPGGTVTRDTPFPEWEQLLQRNLVGISNVGRMTPRSEPEEPSPDPLCILPPNAGYRRLENQLYRVEVHQGGTRAQARFKWSRDNGTVVSAIEPDANGDLISGSRITVAEIGKDGLLTFASDPLPEWLELTDDRYELMHQRGILARVQGVDPATRTITFAPGPLPNLVWNQHPIVRRWDQRGGDATDQGVAMTGDWQALEDGVEIRFSEGIYREGDYWLIPARTAIGFDTGHLEWPKLENRIPAPQPPHGTQHHFARLALLRSNGATFTPVSNGDCRNLFPPLTAITAADVSFSDATCGLGNATNVQAALDLVCQRNSSLCTLLIDPGTDLASALERLGPNPGTGPLDALICLRAGTYPLAAPLRIENRGHIQVMGIGPGTRILAQDSEVALIFSNCASVKVSNLLVQTGVVGRGGRDNSDLNGSLTFIDCPSVTVEAASLRCAGGPLRAGACISVRNTQPLSNSQTRIRGCDLLVGHLQVGILLVNVDRSRINDNLLRAGAKPTDDVLLADIDYRATLRRQLLSGIVPGGTNLPVPTNTNATVTYNDHIVHFRSDPGLIRGSRNNNEWSLALAALQPSGINSPALLIRYLRRFAGELLRTRGNGPGGSPTLRSVIAALLSQDTPAAEQAMVIGGALASDVQVSGNTIRDAIQGIHIGLSTRASSFTAGVVNIKDNTLWVALPTSATRDRHGIFVGHCNSLVIEDNFIGLQRAQRNTNLRTEGMRIFGTLGRRVVVRHNHLGPQFSVGVTFAPLNAPLPVQPLWIITENVMESATSKVDVPGRAPGQPGPADPGAVRQRIRGLNDNFS